MSIHLRATGWPCTIVGLGDRKTGLCRVRLVGGPDDGREIDGVHYSELGGASVECAFYGFENPRHAYWQKRGRRVRRERRRRERALHRAAAEVETRS